MTSLAYLACAWTVTSFAGRGEAGAGMLEPAPPRPLPWVIAGALLVQLCLVAVQVLLGVSYNLGSWCGTRSCPRSSRRPCSPCSCCRSCGGCSDPDEMRPMYLQRPPSRPEPAPDPVPLAIRAATLGVIAAALLGVLLFRLWALQVLHSDQYVAAAARRTASAPSRCQRRAGRSSIATATCSSRTRPASPRRSTPPACRRARTAGQRRDAQGARSGRLRRAEAARLGAQRALPAHVAPVLAPGEGEPGLPGDAAVHRRPPPDRLRARAALAVPRRPVRACLPARLPVAAASSARSTPT